MATKDTIEITNLLWVDCEFTGLDIEKDALIEVAAIITDFDLNIISGEPFEIIINPDDNLTPNAIKNMNSFVHDMHIKNGLIADLETGKGVSLENANKQFINFVKSYIPNKYTALLAGNTISSDQKFLKKYMPKVIDHLHYRLVDVSTIKELSKKWYPEIHNPKENHDSTHRAKDDIIDSINELKFYKENIFK
jgi:oligoribonuclease